MAAVCCPLQECDEYATVYNVDKRRARKEHRCCECRDPIPVGALHEYITMLFDGAWSSSRVCLLCSEIGDHFACGAWYFDQDEIDDSAWEDWPKNRDRQRPLISPIEREEVVPLYERPEIYWPRELELEAAMRAAESDPP